MTKILTLEEAVATFIKDGCHIAIAGRPGSAMIQQT